LFVYALFQYVYQRITFDSIDSRDCRAYITNDAPTVGLRLTKHYRN